MFFKYSLQTCGEDSSFSSITLILTKKQDLFHLLRIIVFCKIRYFLLYHDSYYFIVILDHINRGVDTILSLSSVIMTKIMDLILFPLTAEPFLKIYIYFYFICSIYYDSVCFIAIFDHTNIVPDTFVSFISLILTEI